MKFLFNRVPLLFRVPLLGGVRGGFGFALLCALLSFNCSAQNILTLADRPTSPHPDILWWKFPNGSGTTVTAAVGPNGTTDATWPVGKSGSGYALESTGTNQEAQTVSAVTYSTNRITLTFWAYWDTVTPLQIFLESSPGGTTNVYGFYCSASELHVSTAGTTGSRDEGTAVTAATWRHFLAVIDQAANSGAGEIAIYTNGIVAATTIANNNKSGTAAFSAQTFNVLSRNTDSYWMDGRLDDVRIYSGDQSAHVLAIMGDPQ